MYFLLCCFFFSSRRRHTRCALVTGVQTCALPIWPWIAKTQPRFGPEVKERFDWAATITETEAAAAREQRETFARRLAKLLGDEALLCLPTASGIAPLCGSNAEELEIGRAHV